MKEKEIRLNADKRKSLSIDFRRHCEDQDSNEKEEFLQSREVCNDSIATAFSTAKEVVERKYELDDVATLKSLQNKYNTVNACGMDSCFYFTVTDVKELDQYGDEVEKRKHFSFHLDGRYSRGNGYSYENQAIPTMIPRFKTC